MQKTQEPVLDRAAIAARAYEIFLARGGTHGHDLDDWLQAEAELRQAAQGKGGNGGRASSSAENTSVKNTSAKRKTTKKA